MIDVDVGVIVVIAAMRPVAAGDGTVNRRGT
jgi:hypothetical protein